MSTWPINTARYAPDAPASTDLFGDIIDQLSTTTAEISSISFLNGAPLVANGSFEVNAQAGLIQPTAWTFSNVQNSAGTVITNFTGFKTDHGAWSYQMQLSTAAGSTNAQLFYGSSTSPSASNVTMAISSLQSYMLNVDYWLDNSAITLQATIYWFTATGASSVPTQSLVLANSTINPQVTGAWKTARIGLFPPADATQMTFMIQATTTTNVGTVNAYLDNVYCVLKNAHERVEINTTAPYGTGYTSGFVSVTSPFGTSKNSTIVVPQGAHSVYLKVYGACASSSSGAFGGRMGGYAESTFLVAPNTNITVAIDQNGRIAVTYPGVYGTAQSVYANGNNGVFFGSSITGVFTQGTAGGGNLLNLNYSSPMIGALAILMFI